jgi:hypothetical protein
MSTAPRRQGSSGLPDGILAYQKSQFLYISENLGAEILGKFYFHVVFFGYLVEFTYCNLACIVVIWYIISLFGMLYHEKSGNPGAVSKFLCADFVLM